MIHVPICCQVCERRGDEQVEIVRERLETAEADLHAADARYHITCYQTFTSKGTSKPQPEDQQLLRQFHKTP